MALGFCFLRRYMLVADLRSDHLRRIPAGHRIPPIVLRHGDRRNLSRNLCRPDGDIHPPARTDPGYRGSVRDVDRNRIPPVLGDRQ